MSQYKTKRVAAVLDYAMLWQEWLQTGEQIATSAWNNPSGLTVASPEHSINQAKVWVSGGTKGVTYKLVNTITTNQGRTDARELYIKVIDP